MNSGLYRWFDQGFHGPKICDDMNNAMNKGQAALDMQKSGQWIAQAGMDATAEVLSIQDTGSLINMNPVVILKLKFNPRWAPVSKRRLKRWFPRLLSRASRYHQDQVQSCRSHTSCRSVIFRQAQIGRTYCPPDFYTFT